MTTLRRLQYVKSYLDRHGKARHYFRRRGQKAVALPGPVGSEAFMQAYAKALGGAPVAIGARRVTAGSVASMIVGYLGSAAFANLSEVSQRQYRKRLEWIRRDYGELSIAGLKRKHIMDMLNSMRDTPGAAQDYLRALRLLIRYALDISVIEIDPSIGVRVETPKGDGYHTWSEDEIAAFRAFHPLGSRARLALELLLASALRVSDVVKVGRGHLRNGVLSIVTQKTGKPVDVPVAPELTAAIEAAPSGAMVFLTDERGRPVTAERFTKWFSQQAQQAGVEGSAHGLRKASCRRLAEAGATALEIASISGHASLKEVARYTAQADRAKLARSAVAKIRTATSSV